MGATEEQMQLLSDAGVTHVTYILLLYSVAFLLFLFVNVLLHLYAVNAMPVDAAKPTANGDVPRMNGGMNGGLNGHARMPAARPVGDRDAEEFELEGLMSDDDEVDNKETRRRGEVRI